MSDFKLKDGDKVYIPSACRTVQTVVAVAGTNLVKVGGYTIYDTGYGFCATVPPAGELAFPATQEWYDKLVTVYPNLEKPPARKDLKEITIVVLDGSYRLIKALEDVDGKLIFE